VFSRYSIIYYLLLLNACCVQAQHVIFKTYTAQDGLVANPVRHIFQDSKGFLWIATWEGLSKYDGNKFTNFTTANGLSHNLVNDVYETKEGKILVAENNGSLDVIEHDVVVKKGLISNTTINRFFTLKNGKVLACTDGKSLFEFEQDSLKKLTPTLMTNSFSFFAEWNDSFLVGANDGYTSVLDKQYNIVASSVNTTGSVYCLYTDSKKRLWAGTTQGLKLLTLTPKPKSAINFNNVPFNIPALTKGVVSSFLEDVYGAFWIGTSNGIIHIAPDGKWQEYTSKDALLPGQINCIFQDKEKNIWVGGNFGLSKLVTQNSINVFTSGGSGLLSSASQLAYLSKELLLLKTSPLPQIFNKNTNQFTTLPTDASNVYSGFIRADSNLVFFDFVKNNLIHYSKYSKRSYPIDKLNITTTIPDKEGSIIVGHLGGIVFLRNDKQINFTEVPHRITSLVYDKKGDIWAGTWANGLYHIQYHIKDDSVYSKTEDMSYLIRSKEIRSLFEDRDGNIWVGSRYNGVYCISKNKTKDYAVHNWNDKNGLMSGFIITMAQDRDGSMWIGTILGLDKLAKSDTGFRVHNFSRLTNLYTPVFSILPDSNKQLWVATSSNLLHILDGELENKPPLQVYITSVWLGSGKNKFNALTMGKEISLPHNQNQAEFEFSAAGFINEKQILYSYRLLGSEDTTWSQPENRHSFFYASLKPGRYHFEVRTLGWNGKYGDAAVFSFVIRPPFWQTWWFITIAILCTGVLLYLFYRYRINQLVKLQKVRNSIATDLHDDIGSSLTNISLLAELGNKNIEDPQQAKLFISRISEEASSSGQALDDIVWSINTQNDSLEQVVARMRRYAAEVFDGANIDYILQMDEQFASHKLSIEQRRDLFLIFKESVNNIYKHAKATQVHITLGIYKNRLQLCITDNGKGFNTTAVTHRNGIKNIEQRIRNCKGKLNIRSAAGKGTIIEIDMPV
jgi:ligand-binding sensor domain-containing protein/two-component sensor histidine kinase